MVKPERTPTEQKDWNARQAWGPQSQTLRGSTGKQRTHSKSTTQTAPTPKPPCRRPTTTTTYRNRDWSTELSRLTTHFLDLRDEILKATLKRTKHNPQVLLRTTHDRSYSQNPHLMPVHAGLRRCSSKEIQCYPRTQLASHFCNL